MSLVEGQIYVQRGVYPGLGIPEGGIPGPMSLGVDIPCPRSWGVPYHVTHPLMYVMLPIPHGQTHAYENITFEQLVLRVVTTWITKMHVPTIYPTYIYAIFGNLGML